MSPASRRRFAVMICLLSIILLPRPGQAIVNIEGMRKQTVTDGITGSIDLGINGASGNTDKTTASLSGQLQWQRPSSTSLLIANRRYGKSNDVRDTNKSFLHARHIIQTHERRALEGFVQIEQNEFARLDFRALIGGGLRLTLTEGGSRQAALGLGAFYSSETLTARSGLSDDGNEKLWRANGYLAIDYAINTQTRIISTTYYQPDIGDPADYRLLEQATLKVKLIDKLSLKLTLDIAHDSQPPQAVEKTDITYTSGIEYHF